MNTGQIIYALALAGIFAWRGPSFAVWVLLGNMLATLAVCGAMDLQWITRDNATLSMMLTDFASAAVLITKPGISRIIAAGYGVTVPIYSASIIFGATESATFAVVVAIGFLQLMVAGIGSNDNGLRGRGGRSYVGHPLLLARRVDGGRAGSVAAGRRHGEINRGG